MQLFCKLGNIPVKRSFIPLTRHCTHPLFPLAVPSLMFPLFGFLTFIFRFFHISSCFTLLLHAFVLRFCFTLLFPFLFHTFYFTLLFHAFYFTLLFHTFVFGFVFCFFQAVFPAMAPVDQANCRFHPPQSLSISSISPVMKSPGRSFDSAGFRRYFV